MRSTHLTSKSQIPADAELAVDARGSGEWIVAIPDEARSLHVYRLAPGDWLVSEVGRSSEGRGRDLREALTKLSGRPQLPGSLEALAATLGKPG